MYLVVDNLIEPSGKPKAKQGDTKEKEIENVQSSQALLRSTISAKDLNYPNKFEHKKIINLDSIPLMKNYII
jgi:hypothetical protein